MLNNMLDKLETCILSRFTNEDRVKYVVDTTLKHSLRGISVHGCWLEYLSKLDDRPKIDLILDGFVGHNESGARCTLLQYYLTEYSEIINSISISPVQNLLKNKTINDDIVDLSNLCHLNNKQCRVLANWTQTFEDEEFLSLGGIAEQAGADCYVICFNKSRIFELDLNDIPIILARLKNNLSIPFGAVIPVDTTNEIKRLIDMGSGFVGIFPPTLERIFE